MFGKVWVGEAQSWVSCCVTVKNIHRRIFLAKRDFFTNIKTGDVNEDKPVSSEDLSLSTRFASPRYNSTLIEEE